MTTTDFVHGLTGYQRYHCRCDICTAANRAAARKYRQYRPSMLAQKVDRLTAELQAAELHIECLREENARLRCRLDELEQP